MLNDFDVVGDELSNFGFSTGACYKILVLENTICCPTVLVKFWNWYGLIRLK